MMEKYFANYNQSLALKELGFDELCFGYYDGWNGQTHLIVFDEENPRFSVRLLNLFKRKINQTYGQDCVEYLDGFCTAPLKSQVFEWGRREYGLYHVVHQFEHNKDTPQEFLAEVSGQLVMLNNDISCFSYHSTYEEAESACIDKLIEIVQNGRKIN